MLWSMAERPTTPDTAPSARRRPGDRHRIAADAQRGVADQATARDCDPTGPVPPDRSRRRPAPGRPGPRDRTPTAVRRPALLSERCAGCGAGTAGRAAMVTELVETGSVRVLWVIACSACPDQRRLASGG
jgi:hypothetical protein